MARRLAARIGLPSQSIPPSIPVTGQHAIMVSRVGIRVPATALPIEDVEGPARRHLKQGATSAWLIVAIAVVGCAIAWVLGGR